MSNSGGGNVEMREKMANQIILKLKRGEKHFNCTRIVELFIGEGSPRVPMLEEAICGKELRKLRREIEERGYHSAIVSKTLWDKYLNRARFPEDHFAMRECLCGSGGSLKSFGLSFHPKLKNEWAIMTANTATSKIKKSTERALDSYMENEIDLETLQEIADERRIKLIPNNVNKFYEELKKRGFEISRNLIKNLILPPNNSNEDK
jgi:hypothetical protein